MTHKRLFIPGPTEVRVENLAALARPQVGHRSEEFKQLYRSVVPRLRQLMQTRGKATVQLASAPGTQPEYRCQHERKADNEAPAQAYQKATCLRVPGHGAHNSCIHATSTASNTMFRSL